MSKSFFETGWTTVHHHHSQASGNPVKIGDGCATVTDYKLPLATVLLQRAVAGRRERGHVRSQDIGLVVLVVAPEWSQLLRQEKDEASLFRECESGFLNAFILRFVGDEGFFVTLIFQSALHSPSFPRWSRNR